MSACCHNIATRARHVSRMTMSMTYDRTVRETRLERRMARSGVARAWARRTRWGLILMGLAAIWQERALSPVVHDGMQQAHGFVVEWLEDSESGGYLSAMGGFDVGGNTSEHNAITRALLKMRQ